RHQQLLGVGCSVTPEQLERLIGLDTERTVYFASSDRVRRDGAATLRLPSPFGPNAEFDLPPRRVVCNVAHDLAQCVDVDPVDSRSLRLYRRHGHPSLSGRAVRLTGAGRAEGKRCAGDHMNRIAVLRLTRKTDRFGSYWRFPSVVR